MKNCNQFNAMVRWIVGAMLLVGAVVAHADTETGYFRVGSLGPFYGSLSDLLFIENKTAVPSGTGRCSPSTNFGAFVGNGSVGATLLPTSNDFPANQAMYSTLLAANMAGKQVSIVYNYSTTSSYPFNCLLVSVTIN